MELIRANWKTGTPIRLISVGCTDLVDSIDPGEQLSLFMDDSDWDRVKQEKLESTVDLIRNKLGKNSIGFGLDSKSSFDKSKSKQ